MAAPISLCRYKDLCLDANDPQRLAAFWAPALGLASAPVGESFVLTGTDAKHTVWLNLVPEPKTVKNRVHIDLHVRAVADMLALGATVVDDTQLWTVMADPEGNEFCAFVRQPGALPDYRLYELAVDAADAKRAAMWWGDVLGARADYDDASDSWGVAGAAQLPCELVFGTVPEPKTVKNRMHWDVVGDVEGLLNAGAQLLRAPDEEIDWHVLADPEGNEFCVFWPALTRR